MAAPSDAGGTPGESLSYEQAVERLEAIIERIESGEIGLEDSIAAYEEGTALVQRCRAILNRAEQRIERLTLDDLPAGTAEAGSGAARRADDDGEGGGPGTSGA